MRAVERSEQQAVRNEATFRRANERIRGAREQLPEAADPVPFLCECEDERCTEILLVPLGVYVETRSHADRFIIAAGHESRAEPVDRGDGFEIVEKPDVD